MKPLLPWMRTLLRLVAGFNICAGLFMLFDTHDCYIIIGMAKPDLGFPLQLVGILVSLFGWGYYLVARHPLRNRDILRLGFWSKALGSALGTWYVATGKLPPTFVLVYFFADIVYLPPFYLIQRRLDRMAQEQAITETSSPT